MPMPSYMTISEFPGSVNVQGRENTVEILSFKHQVETPIAGGLVILVSLVITLGILRFHLSNEVSGILLGTLVVMLWGLIDDRFNLRASYKIFGQLLATIIIIGFGVQVHITKIDSDASAD